MTVTEQIMEHVKTLSNSKQAEVLDFVGYLESKKEEVQVEDKNWSKNSLNQAMRGMESEPSLYTFDDIKETS